MIQVEIANSFMLNAGNEFVILLKSTVDARALPISIGPLEAQSIAIKLNNIEYPRPLTHDLFTAVLSGFNCALRKVVVCDLRDDTFYAKLFLEMAGAFYEIDSRPSDAIALALRTGAPIFVEERVMDQASVHLAEEHAETDRPGARAAPVREPAALETMKIDLEKAIAEERYEDAARIRDEIKKLGTAN